LLEYAAFFLKLFDKFFFLGLAVHIDHLRDLANDFQRGFHHHLRRRDGVLDKDVGVHLNIVLEWRWGGRFHGIIVGMVRSLGHGTRTLKLLFNKKLLL
jgi:hypothetical protein